MIRVCFGIFLILLAFSFSLYVILDALRGDESA